MDSTAMVLSTLFRDEDIAHAFLNTLEEAECIICEDSFSATHPATILPGCRHVYGLPCLTRWVMSDNRRHNRCPVCQAVMFDDGNPIDDLDEQVQRERQRTNTGTSGRIVSQPTQAPPNSRASFGHTPGFAGSAHVQTHTPRGGSSQLNPYINYSTPPPGFGWPPAHLDGGQDVGEGDFGVYAQSYNQACNAPSYTSSHHVQAMPNAQTAHQVYQTNLNQQRAAELLQQRSAQTATYGVPAPPNDNAYTFAHPMAPQAQGPLTLQAPTMPPNHAQVFPGSASTGREIQNTSANIPTSAFETRFQYPGIGSHGTDLMTYLTRPHGFIHPHPTAGVRGAWPYEYPSVLQEQIENMHFEDAGLYRFADHVVALRRAQREPVYMRSSQVDWASLDVESVRRGLCGE